MEEQKTQDSLNMYKNDYGKIIITELKRTLESLTDTLSTSSFVTETETTFSKSSFSKSNVSKSMAKSEGSHKKFVKNLFKE